MSMIERVARAMARQHAAVLVRGGYLLTSMQDHHVEHAWPAYADKATAAIEAMREPTDEMLLAIFDHQQGHDQRPDENGASEWYGDLRDLRAGFAAAIDAALK